MTGNPLGTTWVTWNAPANIPWYIVVAKCDLDGDPTGETQLAGSSFQNTIFAYQEGM